MKLNEQMGASEEEMALQPVERNLFVARPPGEQSWLPITFYELADGSRYLHYGAPRQPQNRRRRSFT